MAVQVIDKEITVPSDLSLVTITNTLGKIIFSNDSFASISGYKEEELIGSNHNIVRHPDMPKAIFKMLWDKINRGEENVVATFKNLTKTGAYFWITALFSTKIDDNGKAVSHRAEAVATPRDTVAILKPLYEKMAKIEEKAGVEAAITFFHSFLEDKGISYDELSRVSANNNKSDKKKGGDNFFEKLFS